MNREQGLVKNENLNNSGTTEGIWFRGAEYRQQFQAFFKADHFTSFTT